MITQKNPILFLVWGILELGFVLVLLGIIFFTLNYFNILQLSSISSRFSLLPQASTKPSPTPTLNPDLFAYNFSMADDLLTKYVYKTLQPAYLPTASPSSNIGLTQSHETFSGNWLKGKNTLVKATFTYTPFTNSPNYYKIFISLGDLQKSPITSPEALSQQILSIVFVNEKASSWQCKAKSTISTSQCTSVNYDFYGTKEFVADMNQSASNSAVLSISHCFIPNGSNIDIKNFQCGE